MTTTLETTSPKKTLEPLDRLFNILLTDTMYAELHGFALRFGVSKGHMVRIALEEHFRSIDTKNTLEH